LNSTDVERVAQDVDDILLGGNLATLLALPPARINWGADPLLAKTTNNTVNRLQLFVQIEDLPDIVRLIRTHQIDTLPLGIQLVTPNPSTILESIPGAAEHCLLRTLARLFAFKFAEGHHHLQDCTASSRCRIHTFLQTNKLGIMLLEEPEKLVEIQKRPRNAIELRGDHGVDVT